MLLVDRGQDASWITAFATRERRLGQYPAKCNRNAPICFSPYLYRA